MKIYTRSGDHKKTSLVGGERVSKSELRIDAYGDVDELSAFLSLFSDTLSQHDTILSTAQLNLLFPRVQKHLFVVCSELACRKKIPQFSIEAEDVLFLEQSIDAFESQLPRLTNFVLPGGHVLNSQAHMCRTICRRAERKIVQLSEQEDVQEEILKYINRLSDLLFVLARFMSLSFSAQEVIWSGQISERKG